MQSRPSLIWWTLSQRSSISIFRFWLSRLISCSAWFSFSTFTPSASSVWAWTHCVSAVQMPAFGAFGSTWCLKWSDQIHASSLAVACYDSGSQAKFWRTPGALGNSSPKWQHKNMNFKGLNCAQLACQVPVEETAAVAPLRPFIRHFGINTFTNLSWLKVLTMFQQSCHTASKNLQVPSEKTSWTQRNDLGPTWPRRIDFEFDWGILQRRDVLVPQLTHSVLPHIN